VPISEFLHGNNFDPETARVLGVAFELARSSVHDDFPDDIIAARIIALAKDGERDADRLCELALSALRQQRPRSGEGQARP
jgi:hypothetical protein